MQILTVPLMPASQWADYLAALRRVLKTTDDPGMLDLCRTRYGATPYEAQAAFAAVRGEQREDRIDSEDLRAAFLAFLADGPAPERAPFYAADPDRAYPQRVPAVGHCRDDAHRAGYEDAQDYRSSRGMAGCGPDSHDCDCPNPYREQEEA